MIQRQSGQLFFRHQGKKDLPFNKLKEMSRFTKKKKLYLSSNGKNPNREHIVTWVKSFRNKQTGAFVGLFI